MRFRRIAPVVAAPVAVYAVLVVISLLGGPRIGAPLIPLPGGGADTTSPMAGQPGWGPSEVLPPIPPGGGESPSTPSNALTTPLPSAPAAGDPAGPANARPSLLPTPLPATPTPTLAERSGPSNPPATKTPPVSPSASPTPTASPTTPDDPERPQPQTIGEVLRELAELLAP